MEILPSLLGLLECFQGCKVDLPHLLYAILKLACPLTCLQGIKGLGNLGDAVTKPALHPFEVHGIRNLELFVLQEHFRT